MIIYIYILYIILNYFQIMIMLIFILSKGRLVSLNYITHYCCVRYIIEFDKIRLKSMANWTKIGLIG